VRFGFYLPTRAPTATREGVPALAREERLGLPLFDVAIPDRDASRRSFWGSAPDSPSGRRGRFVQHQIWVTPFHPEERNDGLPSWTARDRTVENTDIVLWHSFGLHHLPRLEDHSVQPCAVCGFKLLPSGFFDQNPVIDLPRTTNAASCCG
jgi:Cu2+-containing amine oxidase